MEAVEEPLLGRSLGELGLVKSIAAKRFGADTITVRVPVPNHPSLAVLDEAIKTAVDRRVTV